MSSYRKGVPRHGDRAWAELKQRNGYALSAGDKFVLGLRDVQKGKTEEVSINGQPLTPEAL